MRSMRRVRDGLTILVCSAILVSACSGGRGDEPERAGGADAVVGS